MHARTHAHTHTNTHTNTNPHACTHGRTDARCGSLALQGQTVGTQTGKEQSDTAGLQRLEESPLQRNRATHPRLWQRFVLQTDASEVGLGAVLSQVHDGSEYPITFVSRKDPTST